MDHLKVPYVSGSSHISCAAGQPQDPECTGDAALQAFQRTLYSQRVLLAALPGTFSQGRTLGFLDCSARNVIERVEHASWPARVLLHVKRNDADAIALKLASCGYSCDPPYDLLLGSAAEVGRQSEILATSPLPARLSIGALCEGSSASHIRALQVLQQRATLTPVPGWVLRGLDERTRTSIVLDDSDQLQGGVSVQRTVFGGESAVIGFGLCIASMHSGRGLAQRLNADAMTQAIKAGAHWAIEIVAPTSGASRRVNEACGLSRHPTDCFLFSTHGAIGPPDVRGTKATRQGT